MTNLLSAGNEFRVNTYTFSEQSSPVVASLIDGGFVVVWQSSEPAGNSGIFGIAAQRYDVDANAVGSEFLVNTELTGINLTGDVKGTPDGGYVIVWKTPSGIAGRCYSADDIALADQFSVGTTGGFMPSVDVFEEGRFIIAWGGNDPATGDTDGFGVSARLYESSGNPLGDKFLVNTTTIDSQQATSLAVLTDGNFVIVWQGANFPNANIMAQRYSTDGDFIGGEFQVNTHSSNFQAEPDVAALSDGGFIVIWGTSDPAIGEAGGLFDSDIVAQRYNADGVPQGTEFLVNTETTNNQSQPKLTVMSDGGFIAAWRTKDIDNDGVAARRYDANSIPIGDEFIVNQYTSSLQFDINLAALINGGFMGVWNTLDTTTGDNDGFGVAARRYEYATTKVLDVLTTKAGIYDDTGFSIASVAALPSGNGEANIVNNNIVFEAGTDFDYLSAGELTDVVVNYIWMNNIGRTVNSSVTIRVLGRA